MYEKHRFYCTKCGKEGLPVFRNQASQRGKRHRKKLYCIYCRKEVNMIECYNDDDIEKFEQNFKKGVYLDDEK